MKVKELSVEELKILIQETVEEKLQEFLGDPDEGLELKEEVKERLKRTMAALKRGEKGKPLEQVARELGLD